MMFLPDYNITLQGERLNAEVYSMPMMDNIVPVEFVENNSLKHKLLPLILTVVVFAVDQITKMLVVLNIEPYTVGASFFGDVLRIIHVYNTGVAFSMGNGLPDMFRSILFAVVPLIALVLVMVVYFRSSGFSFFQRWMIAGIVGGGLGNIFDRFFRNEGVIDFIDVKFYGLFGLERWPTFNIADASVLICGILLIISFLVTMVHENQKEKGAGNDK